MTDLFASQWKPYFYLFFGFIFFPLGVHWTLTGKAWARFGGWVYRAKEPSDFWWTVALYYFLGVFGIGYSLYVVSGPSN